MPIPHPRWVKMRPQAPVGCSALLCFAFAWFFSAQFFERQWKCGLSVTRNDAVWRSTPASTSDVTLPAGCRTEWRSRPLLEDRQVNIFERRGCVVGQPSDPTRLFVLGDSHAAAYGRMARHLAE